MSKLRQCLTCAVDRHRFVLISALFAAALMLRALSAGEYLPILDDSIQYISFPRSLDYMLLIKNGGLFASRPLAILIDLFFVGQFCDCLIIPVLVFSVLHGASGVLFWRLFERRFDTGIAFAVIFSLLPLGVEGTYWLSAASRIVPGLFFCALAAVLLDEFIEKGGIWRAVLFALFSLISYGFYEQILVLSFTLSVLQFLFAVRFSRRAWAAALTLPMLGGYFTFTGLNSTDGAFAERMQFVFPVSPWYFDTFLPSLIRQIGAVFVKGGTLTLFRGFTRGFTLCTQSISGVVYILAAIIFGIAIYALLEHFTKASLSIPSFGVFGFGLLLFLAPLAPYFVIANPWFSLRAAVPSFVGAGLMFDALLRLILRRKRVYSVFCAAFAVVCLIAGASEVHDYHAVGEYDEALAEAILDVSAEMSGRVGILCLESYPIKEQNYTYHEHVGSVGGADWSLYGKLTATFGAELDFTPVPLGIEDFTFYRLWNRDLKRISGFDELWLWDDETFTLMPLEAVQSGGEHDFTLFHSDGKILGRVWEEGEWGYIEIVQ